MFKCLYVYQIHRIEYTDILYLEGLKDYVRRFTVNSTKSIIFHATMKSVEEELPSNQFMVNVTKSSNLRKLLIDNIFISLYRR